MTNTIAGLSVSGKISSVGAEVGPVALFFLFPGFSHVGAIGAVTPERVARKRRAKVPHICGGRIQTSRPKAHRRRTRSFEPDCRRPVIDVFRRLPGRKCTPEPNNCCANGRLIAFCTRRGARVSFYSQSNPRWDLHRPGSL